MCRNPATDGFVVSEANVQSMWRRSGYRLHVSDDDVLAIQVEAHELPPAVREALLNEALGGVRGREVDGVALLKMGAGGLVTVVVRHGLEERVPLGGGHLIERSSMGMPSSREMKWTLARY